VSKKRIRSCMHYMCGFLCDYKEKIFI